MNYILKWFDVVKNRSDSKVNNDMNAVLYMAL